MLRLRRAAGALFGLLLVYIIWVQLPRIHHPDVIAQTRKDVLAQFNEQQKNARDPLQNGFLDETFHTWWGEKKVHDPNNAAGKAFGAWENLWVTKSNEPFDAARLLSQQDADHVKARTDLEPFLPSLHAALARPLFVIPQDAPPSLDSPVPNLLALRSVAQSLAAYAALLTAEDRADEGVAALLPVLAMLNRPGVARASLASLAVSNQLNILTVHRLLIILQTGRVKQPDTYRTIISEVTLALPPPDLLAAVLKGELCKVLTTYERSRSSSWRETIYILAGLWAREMRIYQNVMCALIDEAEHNEMIDGAAMERISPIGGWRNWIVGRSGIASGIFVPKCADLSRDLSLQRRLFVTLHALAALQLWYAQKQAYPEQLQELENFDAASLPGFPWNSSECFGYTRTSDGAELRVKTKANTFETRRHKKSADGRCGYTVEFDDLVVQVKPPSP